MLTHALKEFYRHVTLEALNISLTIVCRLFPVLPGNGRVTQKDLIVGGYLIPKGVSSTMTA